MKQIRISKFSKNRDGAAAIEFAIITPVFLLVLFGIINYGAYLGVLNGVQQLTAEAARASIAGLSDDERLLLARGGGVAGVVGIESSVVSGVLNLESSGVDAPDWRPRHDKSYHEG